MKTNRSGQTCTVSNGTGKIGTANITMSLCPAGSGGTTLGTDDFNRANGSLGTGWTDISDGGLTITGQAVAGTKASGNSGDLRTGESYPADQFSQVTVASTQLTGGQWIGPMVRSSSTGQKAYVGIYYWNSGHPDLMLFARNGSGWTQLGSTYNSGALSSGTALQLAVTGSQLSFSVNGTVRISATDTSLTTGAPGIMSFGTGQVDNWAGGSTTSGPTSYTVGGSVSGLSGSVVLQDNGGDNRTVSANGHVHVRDPGGERRGVRRHGADQPLRPDLHRRQRVGHRREQTSPCGRSASAASRWRWGREYAGGRHRRRQPTLAANGPFTFATQLPPARHMR